MPKPLKRNHLQPDEEPALHPIHLAVELQKLLLRELVNNRSELAKRYGMSRARVTQLLNLLELAPEIQEHLLALEDKKSVRAFSERRLRSLTHMRTHSEQIYRFRRLTEGKG